MQPVAIPVTRRQFAGILNVLPTVSYIRNIEWLTPSTQVAYMPKQKATG
jgi:hypothetical protein